MISVVIATARLRYSFIRKLINTICYMKLRVSQSPGCLCWENPVPEADVDKLKNSSETRKASAYTVVDVLMQTKVIIFQKAQLIILLIA